MSRSGSKAPSTAGEDAPQRGRAPTGSFWTRFVLRLPEPQGEAYSLFLRSRETYALARQVGFSSGDGQDAVWLVRKSIYQLMLAALRLEGDLPQSFEDCRELVEEDAKLSELFADVLEELDLLDEAVGSFELVLGELASARKRYQDLLQRLPRAHGRVRRHLEGRSRRAGVNLALRRRALLASIPLLALVVVLIVYRGCGQESVAAGDVGPVAVSPPEAPPPGAPPATSEPADDDPARCFQATYFADHDFAKPVRTRRDCTILFDWGQGSPPEVPGLPADHFCARWEGWLQVPAEDEYTFHLTSDDGSRLYLDGRLILNNWGNHAAVQMSSEPVRLSDEVEYGLRVEFCDDTGAASMQLAWSSPQMEQAPLPGRLVRFPDNASPVSVADEPPGLLDDSSKCFLGEYFRDRNFSDRVGERRDCRIDFDWGQNEVVGIDGPLVDAFSARWTGVLRPPADGNYVFYLSSDDGSRLYLGDELIVDYWKDHAFEQRWSKPIALEAAKSYPLRVEYYEGTGSAGVRLLWESQAMSKRPLSGRFVRPPGSPEADHPK